MARLEQYFDELLRVIPDVELSEALSEFLNSADMNDMSYDALLSLEEAVGNAVGAPPQGADPAAIAELPRRVSQVEARLGYAAGAAVECVICQEDLLESEDVRVLPCGHEYHFQCIARWAAQKNTCCLCLCVAVPPSPTDVESDK